MKALKFILAVAILFITAMYYNIVSFDRGIVQGTEDEDATAILAKLDKIESVKVGDTYYVFYLTDDEAFIEKATEDEYKVLDTFVEIKEKSIVPGIVGLGAAIVVLIFVGNKKK